MKQGTRALIALVCALVVACADEQGDDTEMSASVVVPPGGQPPTDATTQGGAGTPADGSPPVTSGEQTPAAMPPSDDGVETPPAQGETPPATDEPGDGSEPPAEGSSGCGASDWAPDGPGTFDVEGMTREYIVTLPEAYDPPRAYPVVFAWHGQGGTAEQTANGFFPGRGYLGVEAQAAGGAIFATGQGLPAFGGATGWADDNDFPVVQMLLDHLKANYCVDEARVFSTGASFGGIMSNRIGCNLGDQLRAIAPIMGSGPSAIFGAPSCTGQVAAWITHGRADEVVTFEQGEGSRDHWLAANSCGSEATPIGPEECVEYSGCDADYPVVWCPTDLGHTPPGYSAEEIWKFFQRF